MTAPPALWQDLRRFTDARVALGRAGNGMPTAAHLDFQAAHAAARDAVHAPLDVGALSEALAVSGIESCAVRSTAPDRQTYLLRPDLGRRLDAASLAAMPGCFALVVCDGLSAVAVQQHAVPMLAVLIPALRARGLTVPPVVIASQGRVALGDDVGAALGAAAVAVLIGERPGLSAADSMGAYLTWQPRPGRTDAERNCISNIRPRGLPPEAAAAKLMWLIDRMFLLGLTGVGLKDEQPQLASSVGRKSAAPSDVFPAAPKLADDASLIHPTTHP
jgi:ethanolamine ammonia-lyase small subunit